VVGGDFVVITDTAGHVVGTSVAQTRPVRLPSVRPRVTRSRAAGIAQRQVPRGHSTTSGTGLVVLQRGGSRLAYESTVAVDDQPRLRVYVDALTGGVTRRVGLVEHGDGLAAYSGPNRVHLDTTHTGSTFWMKDPTHRGLSCGPRGQSNPFSGADDHWGTAVSTNKETGCVDALFAAQQEQRMLASWLGRPGVRTDGSSFPVKVGLNSVDAYYDGSKVVIGHGTKLNWLTAIDVVAHELGHGIDDNTPGGISVGGTTEFIADAFATMTEFYSAESAPYDVPDYKIGEEVNIFGTGAIRFMYHPSKVGDPNCWSTSVPRAEVHAAAGPGDHWFFLAAEGSTGATGQPVSPTCNDSTVTGIGIQEVAKILYHAMLMKTSSSSYPKYRTWTLTAAKNLHPGSCVDFNAIKAAWDAVSVPAQPSDPTCGS
jgi:Zn-dependent metalloprotease